ncbi:MAG: hypothetical protein COA49_09385 [Bacteroidetes bacterium]|nr:MAG: hypothetical protein COA49_09385 [Bacteroidota bacterium]
MIAFEGPEVILGISKEDLKSEVQDLANIGKLLPEGAVKDFSSKGDKCSFKVKGGVSIHLEKDSENLHENVLIRMRTIVPTPVKFSLEVVATETENGCKCNVRSDADLNPFTRMMVEPALKSLFEEMSEGMKKRFPI